MLNGNVKVDYRYTRHACMYVVSLFQLGFDSVDLKDKLKHKFSKVLEHPETYQTDKYDYANSVLKATLERLENYLENKRQGRTNYTKIGDYFDECAFMSSKFNTYESFIKKCLDAGVRDPSLINMALFIKVALVKLATELNKEYTHVSFSYISKKQKKNDKVKQLTKDILEEKNVSSIRFNFNHLYNVIGIEKLKELGFNVRKVDCGEKGNTVSVFHKNISIQLTERSSECLAN